MADFTDSPNMNLPIPTVSTAPGPEWAELLNACLTLVDGHDHSPGYGVAISPTGLNINADLTFISNNATHLRSVRFAAQSAPLALATDLGCLYESGVDLYYNDGNGNQIQITQSGGVAGSPGSIGSLASPASATYVAANQTFQWKADSTKSAAMDNGAVTIRETNVASAKGVTLASPTALGADYTLTLPTGLPGSTQYVSCTSGGALGTVSADSIGSAMTLTGANAIGSTMTSTGANAIAASRTRATGTSVSAGGVAISASSSTFSTTSATFVDITNLSVTIVTSGRPVFLGLIGDGVSTDSYLDAFQSGSTTASASITFVRAGTTVADVLFQGSASGTTSVSTIQPPGAFTHIDTPAAGTYTYKIQGKRGQAGTTLFVTGCKLVAYEL